MTKDERMRTIFQELFNAVSSPLYEYRTANKYLPVIGDGSHDAKIMFVGEAPGRNEAKTGKPFCGTAGKVLDTLLAHAHISRESVYITNIVKDRPPKNRDPLPEEIAVYGPFLDRQIEIIQPQAIATLGRYAMGYVMRKMALEHEIIPIGKAHGTSFRAQASYGPIDIIVLYHPCVAVYNPRTIDTLKADFEILRRYA